jgi:hypothetical protein
VSTLGVRDEGFAEPSLPRANGEPTFDAPWQARAHALAVLCVEASGRGWDDFRGQLMAAVKDDDQRPYWESWVIALDAFIAEWGVVPDVL